MLVNNNYILGLIVFLFAIIGYLTYKLHCKRREDIIKLLIRRDTLPTASGSPWVQGGVCYMKDGKIGRVDGTDCVSMTVL